MHKDFLPFSKFQSLVCAIKILIQEQPLKVDDGIYQEFEMRVVSKPNGLFTFRYKDQYHQNIDEATLYKLQAEFVLWNLKKRAEAALNFINNGLNLIGFEDLNDMSLEFGYTCKVVSQENFCDMNIMEIFNDFYNTKESVKKLSRDRKIFNFMSCLVNNKESDHFIVLNVRDEIFVVRPYTTEHSKQIKDRIFKMLKLEYNKAYNVLS
ncbi:hypothetical protein ACHJH3_06720 [Campylobacter sp. MOP7]|uniref:hypothetical protein n=1 Tax=Campylobacter canis TaxID=3378588 RepID=UPI00387E7C62